MHSRQKSVDKICFVDYYVYIANRKRGENMVATVLKNNLEEQKEDLREMASLLKEMSKEDRKKLKYVMMGMQIMKGAEKAG